MAGAPGPFAASAAEMWRSLPPVGAGGNQVPLGTFDEMLRGEGASGAARICSIKPAPRRFPRLARGGAARGLAMLIFLNE